LRSDSARVLSVKPLVTTHNYKVEERNASEPTNVEVVSGHPLLKDAAIEREDMEL
jgi:hypothetical protein